MATPPFRGPNGSALAEYSKKERETIAFYKGIENEAKDIPYSCVPDDLSIKVAEKLTHPNLLPEIKRWPNVVSAMGTPDPILHAKFDYYKCFGQPAFYIFLTSHYVPKQNGTLWGLINGLLINTDCIDVLVYIQKDIADFLEKYRASLINQDSHDSGFASHTTQDSYMSMQERENLQLQTAAKNPIIKNEKVLHFTVPQTQLLIGPSPEHIRLKLEAVEGINNDSSGSKGYPDSFPNSALYNNSAESYWHDPSVELKKKLLNEPDAVKVFIPHTLEEEDERAAEDLSKSLREKYQIKTILFKDLLAELCEDVPHVVQEILDNMDFIVPVISKAYLEQIKPVGNPDFKPPDCLNLRYLHAVSQGRVVNMNSLNYLIRPVMLDDVNYGLVRRCHEFRCAIRYPKDLNRLASILNNTKRMTSCS